MSYESKIDRARFDRILLEEMVAACKRYPDARLMLGVELSDGQVCVGPADKVAESLLDQNDATEEE